MVYDMKMIGTYIGCVMVDDKRIGKGFVIVGQKRFVTASIEAKSVEEGLEKLYESSENAICVREDEPVDGTLYVCEKPQPYATQEQIDAVKSRIDSLEMPNVMVLATKSLKLDYANAVMGE